MDGHLTKMGAWRPEPPVRYERFPKGRHWWLIAPFYLPQSSVFWRRELFERNGLFSEDLTYMFDGEFMCRLALAGEKLALIPGEALSVRGVHEEQKSATPSLLRGARSRPSRSASGQAQPGRAPEAPSRPSS